MRLSAKLLSTLPWLSSLKSAQLQRIARATGIQSSGTKPILIQRLQAELPSPETSLSDEKPWSILSIDMGVQNFAFAHLRVPHYSRSNSTPELMDWHRLAVSDIGNLDLRVQKLPIQKKNNNSKDVDADPKSGYSPDVYAANAYSLVTSLVAAYKPTHVLIERQRFRSGGASAVLEWTLRVGILEGMLHAVLYSLARERGGEMAGVIVKGVEPKRVVGYWMESGGTANVKQGDEIRKRLTAREVKQMKIDLVGQWLSASVSADKSDTISDASVHHGKISILGDRPVQELVDAYLRKWRKERRASSSVLQVGNIGKLDDLADCLLQGVTWLEWQTHKERLVREGEGAIESIL
ncbi:hypothetical protein N7495_000446 [Penicillium taxi]|uniref:uncharacterized protein n=1 Tax=Penicillium taxi TaxID=168475 RepID=UPI00254595F8|nr:uncharacterized protein N7495_000446 [Penicillium taxi]KAJ5907764.1 hypothetical protein N7495_000446 [Penicillium taxi]